MLTQVSTYNRKKQFSFEGVRHQLSNGLLTISSTDTNIDTSLACFKKNYIYALQLQKYLITKDYDAVFPRCFLYKKESFESIDFYINIKA